MTNDEFKRLYDPPDVVPITRVDGKPLSPHVPPHAIPAVWLGINSEEITLHDAQIVLSDFGTAFKPILEERYESHAPWVLQPPEAHFEPSRPLSFPSDIWGLGYAIFAIFAQRPLHDSFMFSRDDVIADQLDFLGPLPQEWWDRWDGRDKLFAENGVAKHGRKVWTFDMRSENHVQRCLGENRMGEEEVGAFCEMIRGMLRWRPEERLNIKEVMGITWMQRWGLPSAGIYEASSG